MSSFLYRIRHSLLSNDTVRNVFFRLFYRAYHSIYVPILARRIRKKEKIKVLFVLFNLGMWKTKALFNLMQENKRFEPLIMIEPSGKPYETESLKNYLEQKGYPYLMLEERQTIKSRIHPDIIFYQQPYGTFEKKNDYYQNFYALFCFVDYAFHGNNIDQFYHAILNNLAWQNYFENKLVMKNLPSFMPNKACNCLCTGLPMTDIYKQVSSDNPWKPQEKPKKRIIYAPHHTISSQEWLHFSTFLTYSDTMLLLAKKYSNKVQFAFKPHPALRGKLEYMWGKEKTDKYYQEWATMDNTQLEEGQYASLFIHSDAMIHDCSSFSIEYHYSQHPVMYLVREEHKNGKLNDFATTAFNLHYMGKNADDIEHFIQMVISGDDPMAPKRKEFYDTYLKIPFGKSASENIINSILSAQVEKQFKSANLSTET